MNSRMSWQVIGIKTLCIFVFCVAFALIDAIAKQRHCTFRVHAQANAHDTDVFSISARARSSGKDVAIQKLPWITEHDVVEFAPYNAQVGNYCAPFMLDMHWSCIIVSHSMS